MQYLGNVHFDLVFSIGCTGRLGPQGCFCLWRFLKAVYKTKPQDDLKKRIINTIWSITTKVINSFVEDYVVFMTYIL